MASLAARLHSSRFQSYRPYLSPCHRCIRAHHSCYSCASSEGRAPAAGTNLAPPGDRQAPAVDEGPFLSRTLGSSANPDGGSNTGLTPLDPSQQWPQMTTLSS